jgi:hypothetical protein
MTSRPAKSLKDRLWSGVTFRVNPGQWIRQAEPGPTTKVTPGGRDGSSGLSRYDTNSLTDGAATRVEHRPAYRPGDTAALTAVNIDWQLAETRTVGIICLN